MIDLLFRADFVGFSPAPIPHPLLFERNGSRWTEGDRFTERKQLDHTAITSDLMWTHITFISKILSVYSAQLVFLFSCECRIIVTWNKKTLNISSKSRCRFYLIKNWISFTHDVMWISNCLKFVLSLFDWFFIPNECLQCFLRYHQYFKIWN